MIDKILIDINGLNDLDESNEELIFWPDANDEQNTEDINDALNLSDQENIEPEIIDLAKFTFEKHTRGGVHNSDLSSDSELAITGGADKKAFVWSTSTGEVLFECTGHTNEVTNVCFNHDNQLVATGDFSGMIQVWSVTEKKTIWSFQNDDQTNWLIWHPSANVLISGRTSADVYIWQIPEGNSQILPSPNSTCTTYGKLLPNGNQLLVVYDDKLLKLWDIENIYIIWSNSQNEITSLDVNRDGSLVLLSPGAQIVNLTDGRTTSTFLFDDEIDIHACLFSSELGNVVTVSDFGELRVWELQMRLLLYHFRIECTVNQLKCEKDKMFIGAWDGTIYVCNVESGELLEILTGHTQAILSISAFKNDNKILTTSEDGTAKIFEINV